MILSDVSIRRPVFTTMVVTALVALGLLGVRFIGVDLFPDVSFPVVVVTTPYPGAGPAEVEQLVTRPIEETLSSVNGVDEVRSYSRDSVSTVVVQFKLEADIKAAANDVRDRMSAVRSLLPRDILDPVIQRMDFGAVPILTYVVSAAGGSAEARRLAEDLVKPRLEAVEGVASVVVTGGLEREVHVYVDRAKLEALGLSLAQVAQQLGMESFDVPAGRITVGSSELTVKTEGRFRSLADLRNAVVASLQSGAQVRLSDVARIEDGFKEVRKKTRIDGEDAVFLDVQKASGTNTVAIADQVYTVVEEVRKALPPGAAITNAVDSSLFIRMQARDVSEAIVFGGAMAILVIFLFMLDWRSTLISSLALPTSVITTFFFMWWMGFTFNIMTLMALSLAIGLLIDDAVVVRENIYRHMERGEDPITAARKGTAEIGLAVMATTFTIVAVFVPVAFMGGVVGRMFKQFGLTVAAAVLVSLFISFTLDPMMSARVVKAIQPGHHEELRRHRIWGPIVRFYDRMDADYRKLLAWALEHKKTVAFSAFGLFVGSLLLVGAMGKEFVAPADRGEFQVTLEAPAGTSLGEMDRLAREAEALIRKNPEVRHILTTVGAGGEAHKTQMRVYISKVEERRPLTQWQVQAQIREALAALAGVRFTLSDPAMFEGAPVELPITLAVRGGDDFETLRRVAEEALRVVQATRGVTDADLSYRAGKQETTLRVDRARAADLGVSVGTVAQTMRLALEGEVVAKYREGERDLDVRLQLFPEDRARPEVLRELTVPATGRRLGPAPGGPTAMLAMMSAPRLVRVGEVAKVTTQSGPSTIERMNRQRQIVVTASLVDRSLGDAVADIQKGLDTIERPPGVRFVFGGQAQRMQETFSNMLLALAVAVLFIYFVLASQFESFVHPFTIMLSLPLAIVGALLALFLAGKSIGMAAMIGIILLMGLVTKNAILLVDYTNELRARGRSMIDALLEAGPTRLRPILMTSAAMVLGMLPSALARGQGSEFRVPMSVAVIGGVVTSTFLTLLVVPVVYTWMDRFTRKNRSAATVDPFAAEAAEAVDEAPALALPRREKA